MKKSNANRLHEPVISVIVPAYNEESNIAACLDALTTQTRPADEIIVVDNNSSDKTAKIASSYDNVLVISETRRQGIAAARNAGFDIAKGDILCRIDSDSIVPKNWIESILGYFQDHPETLTKVHGIAGSADYNFNRSRAAGRVVGLVIFDMFYFPITKLLLGANTLFGSNMAITRTTWEKICTKASLDNSIHEDIDLSAQILTSGGDISRTKLPRVKVSPRSLVEPPAKTFWRIKSWPKSISQTKKLFKK